MRYVIRTSDIGSINTINAMISKKKIECIEKGDPVEDMKNKLDSIKQALDILKNSGINEQLMINHIKAETQFGFTDINKILNAQKDFFKKLGVK